MRQTGDRLSSLNYYFSHLQKKKISSLNLNAGVIVINRKPGNWYKKKG